MRMARMRTQMLSLMTRSLFDQTRCYQPLNLFQSIKFRPAPRCGLRLLRACAQANEPPCLLFGCCSGCCGVGVVCLPCFARSFSFFLCLFCPSWVGLFLLSDCVVVRRRVSCCCVLSLQHMSNALQCGEGAIKGRACMERDETHSLVARRKPMNIQQTKSTHAHMVHIHEGYCVRVFFFFFFFFFVRLEKHTRASDVCRYMVAAQPLRCHGAHCLACYTPL